MDSSLTVLPYFWKGALIRYKVFNKEKCFSQTENFTGAFIRYEALIRGGHLLDQLQPVTTLLSIATFRAGCKQFPSSYWAAFFSCIFQYFQMSKHFRNLPQQY